MKYRALLLATSIAQYATKVADLLTVAAVRSADAAHKAMLNTNRAAYETKLIVLGKRTSKAYAVVEALEFAVERAKDDAAEVALTAEEDAAEALTQYNKVAHAL